MSEISANVGFFGGNPETNRSKDVLASVTHKSRSCKTELQLWLKEAETLAQLLLIYSASFALYISYPLPIPTTYIPNCPPWMSVARTVFSSQNKPMFLLQLP
jgi:hypothetical protein